MGIVAFRPHRLAAAAAALLLFVLAGCASPEPATDPPEAVGGTGVSEGADPTAGDADPTAGDDDTEDSTATTSYPERPIEVIVAFDPGGGMDVTARILAQTLGEKLGTEVVINNISGGGGAVGFSTGVDAPPDGYTLSFVSPAIVEHEYFRTDAVPYNADTWEVSYMVSNQAHVVVVPADSEFTDAIEIFDAAAEAPESVLMGVGGQLSSQDIARALLEEETGVEFATVFFDGGAPVVTSLLAGDVEFGLLFQPEVAGQLEAGELRGLATTGAERSAENPDLPTLTELGIEVDGGIWRGLLAPVGTPPEVMEVLNAAVAETVEDPEWLAAMEQAGIPVVIEPPEEFAESMAESALRAQSIADIILEQS